jgi:diguanylate cyclase (GGDEF)-like protein
MTGRTMTRVRALLPRTVLQRVRLAALLFACSAPASQFPIGMGSHVPEAAQVRGFVALVLLIVVYLVTFARRRTTPLCPIVVGLLIFFAGYAMVDPMAVIALCIGTMVHQSLYGGRREAIMRTFTVCTGYLLTIGLSAAAAQRGLHPGAPIVVGNLPGIIGAGAVMRVLLAALTRHRQTAARDAVLARVAAALLGETDATAIRRIAGDAGAELCALQPGVGVLRVRVEDDRVTVENSNGELRAARGATLPLACVAGLDPTDDTIRALTGDTSAFDRLAGRRMHWSAMRLSAPDAPRFVVVGAEKPLSHEVLSAHRVLAAQVSLAEDSAAAHGRLVHQANHDQLTGLPNRTALYRLLADTIDGTDETTGAAVLHIDLDDFKVVNDTFGHTAGDELLVEVARRLRAVAGIAGTAARVGGDEFVLVLPDAADPAAADRVAERLLAALEEPVRLRDTTIPVRASVGIAHAAPGLSAGDVVRCADIAMYTAKDEGKHRVERFDSAQHGRIARLRTLEEHLPYAVERGEIVVHYQPQVDLRTGRVHGVEALARWDHPRLGRVAPLEFIPVAERTGAIEPIGAHVLRTACARAAEWAELPGLGDLRLSVNVSARQLTRDSLPRVVRSALADSGLPAEQLTLELTESELLEGQLAVDQLVEIADLGVRIAIDDFGTGYASLAYLRSLPVHQVKIDRSFVPATEDAPAGADDIARAVLLVGQTLGLETVAEGVELCEQADALETAGVQIAQGYLFARPMAGDEFAAWATAAESVATT